MTIYLFVLAGSLRELVEYLNSSTELLAKNGNILDNVLETLDMQQHSLGVLYVLVAKFNNLIVSVASSNSFHIDVFVEWGFFFRSQGSPADAEQMLRLVREFVTGCNGEQVRLASATCKQDLSDTRRVYTNFLC